MAPVSDTQTSTTTITISSGALAGTLADGIRRFLGIPYARPPFGERRFALPAPVEPWEGTRDATAHRSTAPQDPYWGATAEILGSVAIAGDDILTVNVWAPADPPSTGLPVIVWIHGGALERGTAALPGYDGASFARDGVVFVSINYRLGAEGFSVLEGAPLNLGLADAAAAVGWVHAEIRAFGGDPDRVTLVGESAGGALVAALLMRPDTAPLVAGAAIESGPLDAVPSDTAGRVTVAMAEILGVPPTREAFAALSPQQLLDARRQQSAGSNPLSGNPGYMLALDDASLPTSPAAGLAEVGIPLVIGTNTDEYRLWFTPEALEKINAAQLLAARLALKIPGKTVKRYREAFPGGSAGEILGQILTDRLLRGPAVQVADRRSAPTYVYEFAWRSPVRDLRAAHGLDIGFVFDALHEVDSVRLAGPDAPQVLADRMHGDWVRFIATGDPGWPPFLPERRVQLFAEESTVEPLPRAEALAALPL
jgi:para-nitrobenzyl esterase